MLFIHHVNGDSPLTSAVGVRVLGAVFEVEPEATAARACLDIGRRVPTEASSVVVVAEVICVLERTSDCVYRF